MLRQAPNLCLMRPISIAITTSTFQSNGFGAWYLPSDSELHLWRQSVWHFWTAAASRCRHTLFYLKTNHREGYEPSKPVQWRSSDLRQGHCGTRHVEMQYIQSGGLTGRTRSVRCSKVK
ncbi:unnamed protein product, partial [Ixodes pacificus]